MKIVINLRKDLFIMELYISLAAMLISLVSVIVSVAIYMLGISRDKKQATLDAFNISPGTVSE